MKLKSISNASDYKNYEKELYTLFLKEFNKHKSQSFLNEKGYKRIISIKYNPYSNIWFNYKKTGDTVNYLLGNLDFFTKIYHQEEKGNSINPYINLNMNFSNINESNCRFAYNPVDYKKFVLLETVSDKKIINDLKLVGLQSVSFQKSQKNFFVFELNKLVQSLESLIHNINFYPVLFPLKIKNFNKKNLKQDLYKIRKNIPLYTNSKLPKSSVSSRNTKRNLKSRVDNNPVQAENTRSNSKSRVDNNPVKSEKLVEYTTDKLMKDLVGSGNVSINSKTSSSKKSTKTKNTRSNSKSKFKNNPVKAENTRSNSKTKISKNPKKTKNTISNSKSKLSKSSLKAENNSKSKFKNNPVKAENTENNTKIKLNKNSTDNNNVSSKHEVDKMGESNNSLDKIECDNCHKLLPKKDFMKKPGTNEYEKVCKDCENRIFAAKFLELFLSFVNPGEKFNKEKLIREHSEKDFNEIIFTLQEQDLVKNDSIGDYYLESKKVVNDFLETYLKESPHLDEKITKVLKNKGKPNNKLVNNIKTEYDLDGADFKWINFNPKKNKWEAYAYDNYKEKIFLGSFYTEIGAYQERFKFLQNIEENIETPEKNSIGHYSDYEGVSYNKLNSRWYSQVKINSKTKLILGQFGSEDEAYQARLGYLTENHKLFNDPHKKNKGRFSNFDGVNYNYAYHKWYSYVLNDENKDMLLLGYFDSEDEAADARSDYLNGNYTICFEKPLILKNPQKKGDPVVFNHDGVSYDDNSKKWFAYVLRNDRTDYLGKYDSMEEAYHARETYLKKQSQFKIKDNDSKSSTNLNSEKSPVNFFINKSDDYNEVLVKGILSVNEAFNSLNKLKSIHSEINQLIFNNINDKIELLIEIKVKKNKLISIISLFNKLGWKQLM